MIIVFSDQENLKAEFSSLPEEILLQGKNYSLKRQRSFYSGRLLLQKSLYHFFKCDSLPKIILQEHNRPIFADSSKPLFSLSHTGGQVAVALSYYTLGLDIELVRDHSLALWNRILSEQELECVKNSKNPQELFTLLWTLRESLLKSDGLGLVALSKIKCDLKNLKVYYPSAQRGQVISYILSNNLCMSTYKSIPDSKLALYSYINGDFKPVTLSPKYHFEVYN